MFGLCFGALLSVHSLTTFWFIKGDKFLIPTYRYYMGIGVFLVLSLADAYSISRVPSLLHENTSLFRKIISGVIVATSPLLLFTMATALLERTATTFETPTGTTLVTNIDPITLHLLAIIGFVLLISAACWILTGKLSYIAVFLNLLALPVALSLMYLVYKIHAVPGEWSDFFAYPVYYSLLSASCGFWIATAKRVVSS